MMATMELSPDAVDFIDEARFGSLLTGEAPAADEVEGIVAKSLAKEALSLEEAAALLRVRDPAERERIYAAARQLKQRVYGNRIVLFAPLYIGNRCINDCRYCAFRASNPDAERRTLGGDEIQDQVKALERQGHKRLILVYGEHRDYDADFIAESVKKVYATREGKGEIRRVNINAAPLDEAGFKTVKDAGIGTYQIFMETYHHETYRKVHPENTRKGDYLYRLDGLNRAFRAGIDDVGIGALFGLADWRFDTLGLVAHAIFLKETYGVGPHTISFPRLQPAQNVDLGPDLLVDDEDFKYLIAVLRLAVPYTGLILTARESAELRRAVMAFGVSQIDAGSRIELGGYTEAGDAQVMAREQFKLGDVRSLDEVMRELLEDGYLPSFCTACYRAGRTGEHFMEFAVPGFIKRFCTPNGLLTLQEFLCDYASDATRAAGEKLIDDELAKIPTGDARDALKRDLERTRTGERDLYY